MLKARKTREGPQRQLKIPDVFRLPIEERVKEDDFNGALELCHELPPDMKDIGYEYLINECFTRRDIGMTMEILKFLGPGEGENKKLLKSGIVGNTINLCIENGRFQQAIGLINKYCHEGYHKIKIIKPIIDSHTERGLYDKATTILMEIMSESRLKATKAHFLIVEHYITNSLGTAEESYKAFSMLPRNIRNEVFIYIIQHGYVPRGFFQMAKDLAARIDVTKTREWILDKIQKAKEEYRKRE